MRKNHKGFRARIDRAKRLLPLPKLMELLGDEDAVGTNTICPFHDDTRPSFSVFQGEDDLWFWKCHAGCGAGDEINYLEMKQELTRGDAMREFLELAGVKKGRMQ